MNIKQILNNMQFGTDYGFTASKILSTVEINLRILIGEWTEQEGKDKEKELINFYSKLDPKIRKSKNNIFKIGRQ